MFNYIRNLLKRPQPPVMAAEQPERRRTFSTEPYYPQVNHEEVLRNAFDRIFQKPLPKPSETGTGMNAKLSVAMDGFGPGPGSYSGGFVVSETLLTWYASQSFIGYQMCAIMAQQWLISKCCSMPGKDAVRNGYKITINDGTELEAEVLDQIKHADVKYQINKNLIEFVQMGRVFGIRIALFLVDSDDEEYYAKPFNIDGVTEGSYKGISQIDPYWITPQLDSVAAGDPAAKDFYEPTWWRINGRLVHRSHLVIFKTEEVADILKPTYIYGGIPIPQKIYERVYAAERIASEAPQLALTKRTGIIKCDVTQAAASPGGFDARAQRQAYLRDNYAFLYIGEEEEFNQFDTSLGDLDVVIMTQYQLVASAANVPATKLLGTQPKGFNSTGEFEEASYHEELESIQTHDLTPLLNRHHLLLIKSEISPNAPFETTVTWSPLDAMTNKELAELNKLKADTASVLASVGAIDGEDERNRIITDPESGYDGLLDGESVESDLTDA